MKSRFPRTLGNAWGLQDDGTRLRYLSDQYAGKTMGYEERGGLTLAETPPLAIGMAAFGHGVGLERPLPEEFEYHVVDETLDGKQPRFAAKSQGVIAQRYAAHRRHAYRTIIALTEAQAGIVAQEALRGSPRYTALMGRIAAARKALQAWDKDFHLDRISLSLLAGAPNTRLTEALDHYGLVAKSLRHDAAIAAGQSSFPHIVVSQSAGSAEDGRSEVILAEGQLDLAFPMLRIVVATPKYPYAMMPNMPSTHTPEAQMLVDELEAIALATVKDNQRWYCPSMRQASLHNQTAVVEFTTLSDLKLGTGDHGFALQGCKNDAKVKKVQVEGNRAYVTFDKIPDGRSLFVTYAWGAHHPNATDGHSANQGAIRDSWTQSSLLQHDVKLHRYALSGRIRMMPIDLSVEMPGEEI